jgi:hypothetical protein
LNSFRSGHPTDAPRSNFTRSSFGQSNDISIEEGPYLFSKTSDEIRKDSERRRKENRRLSEEHPEKFEVSFILLQI